MPMRDDRLQQRPGGSPRPVGQHRHQQGGGCQAESRTQLTSQVLHLWHGSSPGIIRSLASTKVIVGCDNPFSPMKTEASPSPLTPRGRSAESSWKLMP